MLLTISSPIHDTMASLLRLRTTGIAIATLGLLSAPALAPAASAQPPGARSVAITRVHVLPMESAAVLRDYTLIIRDGEIAAMGPAATTAVPPDAERIDGRGRYLLPGLYDLYTHIHEWALPQFLAYGVTTVRNAAPGRAAHLALREDIAAGRRIGPRVFSTGPVLDGIEPSYSSAGSLASTEEARRIVRAHQRTGYDAVMIYVGIEPLPYFAVLDEARRIGLPVTGHTPWKVPRELVHVSGQRSRDNLVGEVDTESGAAYVPERERDRDAARIAESGQWTIPTLTIHKARARRDSLAVLLAIPGIEQVPPRQRMHWTRAFGRLVNVPDYQYTGAPDLVSRLHRAGARLLVGTDAGYPFIIPGIAMHEELRNLVEVGLTPYEALRAATRDAAEFLGELDAAGTIAVGKRADLVLLRANPLADVATLADPVGVVLRGRWLPVEALRAESARLASARRERFAMFAALPCAAPATCARYDIRARGLSVGEERVAMTRSDGVVVRLSAQSSIDPHLETRTSMEYRRVDGSATLRVHRWVAGAPAEVQLHREDSTVQVEVQARGSSERWVQAADPAVVLGGPLQGVNVDVDLVGTLQLVVAQAATMVVGESRLVDGLRAELNEEEHGRAGLVGAVTWRVTRTADDAEGDVGASNYTVLVPGLNGSGMSRWQVTVDRAGVLRDVRSADGYLHVVRADGPSTP